jgi:hypothetical protein
MSLVIVDDSDSSVQYNTPGGWNEAGKDPEFKGTTHASATQGDTATLVFEGACAQSFWQDFTEAWNLELRDVD